MTPPRSVSRLFAGSGLAVAAAVLLAGCVNETALDDLRDTRPSGPPFSQALFRDYRALARSFGPVGAAAGVAFDTEGSMQLTEMDSSIGALANAYATKAIIAARGSVVEPDPGVDVPTHKMRDRVIRALDRGRDSFPADAARVQVQYDCWMMNGAVPQMVNASRKCKAALEVALTRLEGEAKPAPVAAPPTVDANSDKPAGQP